jgi:hypothetical protein
MTTSHCVPARQTGGWRPTGAVHRLPFSQVATPRRRPGSAHRGKRAVDFEQVLRFYRVRPVFAVRAERTHCTTSRGNTGR